MGVKRGKFKPYALARLMVKNNRTGFSWRSPRPMRALVDSGASITILPTEAAPLLRKKTGAFDHVAARVQTANGIKEAVAMKDVSLCLDAICFRGDVLVTDDISGDMLLGSDFLSRAKCKLDLGRKTLTCNGRRIRMRMER